MCYSVRDGKCVSQSGMVSVIVSQDGKCASQLWVISVLVSQGW